MRRALLDAAAAVFARQGIEAASLDEVAAEAGFTKGAIYSNFDGKEGLIDALVADRTSAYLDLGLEAVLEHVVGDRPVAEAGHHRGHDAGDEVLCETAHALVGAVRAQDTVVRPGGDEFCVLAPQTDAAHAEHLGARVRESLAAVTTGVSGLSASIGTAVCPADGTTPEDLLAEADKAALEAKRHSRLGRAQRRAA